MNSLTTKTALSAYKLLIYTIFYLHHLSFFLVIIVLFYSSSSYSPSSELKFGLLTPTLYLTIDSEENYEVWWFSGAYPIRSFELNWDIFITLPKWGVGVICCCYYCSLKRTCVLDDEFPFSLTPIYPNTAIVFIYISF